MFQCVHRLVVANPGDAASIHDYVRRRLNLRRIVRVLVPKPMRWGTIDEHVRTSRRVRVAASMTVSNSAYRRHGHPFNSD
jgi:hypothetical protein